MGKLTRFVIQCPLAPNSDAQRVALRPKHLQYIQVHKEQIFCGGPTVNDAGKPEMMLILFDAPDLATAEAFINAEPYHRAGVFERVTVREWRQILPESEPGALLREIDRAMQ